MEESLDLSEPQPLARREVLGNGWIELHQVFLDEAWICRISGICVGKDDLEVRRKKLVNMLTSDPQHKSPFEFLETLWRVHCPLYTRSQWQRKRMAEYQERSGRWVSPLADFYTPSDEDFGGMEEAADSMLRYKAHMQAGYDLYRLLISRGMKREQARGVCGQAMMTTFWDKTNLSSLFNFLHVRDEAHAQHEIRVYAKAMKEMLAPYVPVVAETLGWKQPTEKI
jgi:thymidylate synthase (FAD)